MKKVSTPQTIALAKALKIRGVELELEYWDGHKHVDIYIPKAKIYIEVDGPLHDLRPKQAISDFNRDYFSYKEGFFTKHITNEEVENHLEKIADSIAFIVKNGTDKMGNNLHNTTGGFVGILMILITVTVIIFIMFRTDLFGGKKASKSMIERDLDAVQQAKDVKALLEKNSAQSIDID